MDQQGIYFLTEAKMVVKRKRYEFKLYINHDNSETWNVIDGCEDENLVASDFICKAAIKEWKSRKTIEKKRYISEPEIPVQMKKILPPTLRDEEAEETDRMLASGEWEIVYE